ncbi:hypothetical protein K3728_16560 [Rhodobacteraceae bacterium M385]|nr:hypothetical protein K3728_16560 [Rhodobacteraceae bacterium M385]
MSAPTSHRINPQEETVLFARAIGWKLILGCIAIAALGAVVLPIAWQSGEWVPFGAGVFLLFLGVVLSVALLRKRAKAEPGPAVTLSPNGLEMHQNAVGVVPWSDVERLSYMNVKATQLMLVHIAPAAMARLAQSNFLRKARKLDTAVGVSALTFHQQNLEIPLPDFETMLHTYSVTHGGPALQAAP